MPYDRTDKKECVTENECYARGGYQYAGMCGPQDKCVLRGLYPSIFGHLRGCRKEVPAKDGGFDPQ